MQYHSEGNHICSMFECATIGMHYRSSKSMALAYLMTIGSKALVLMDVNNDSADEELKQQPNNELNESIRKSFGAEANIRRKMICEEKQRQLRRMLIQKPGILVFKRGRNGKVRKLNIRLKETKCSGNRLLTQLEWKSNFQGKGYFTLHDLVSVDVLHRQHDSGDVVFSASLPFIRLQNSSRRLDIKLDTLDLTSTFIEMLQKKYIKSSLDLQS